MFLRGVGLLVIALVIAGFAQAVFGIFTGTATVNDIPVRINNEFAGVGVSVQVQGQNGGAPVPYQGVSGQGADPRSDRMPQTYPALPGAGR